MLLNNLTFALAYLLLSLYQTHWWHLTHLCNLFSYCFVPKFRTHKKLHASYSNYSVHECGKDNYNSAFLNWYGLNRSPLNSFYISLLFSIDTKAHLLSNQSKTVRDFQCSNSATHRTYSLSITYFVQFENFGTLFMTEVFFSLMTYLHIF